jgi:hypothetical protein
MRITEVMLIAALFGGIGCSSPDDASGDLHLELVQAPESATPGSPDPQSIIVKVVDGDGTAVPGVPMSWAVRSGGGSLEASADTSGVDGLAVAQWRPGLLSGTQEIGAYLYDQPALVITVGTEVFHADKLASMFERGCGLQGTAVWCWRDDYPAWPIRRILPQVEAHDVAATYQFACILDAAGATYCNRAFEGLDPQAASAIPGLPPLKSISGSVRSFCGLAVADATPWCWRDFEMVPHQLAPSPALSGLSTGGGFACGLDAAGAAWCWGLPLGSPTLVPGGHAFQSVSTQDDQAAACGIEGSAVLCWLGTTSPVRVAGLSAGQVALGWPFVLVNTGPVAAVADAQTSYETASFGLDLDVYADRAFPFPVRQVYPGCVLTSDHAAYCLAAYNINEPVFPIRTYWKAVPAPEP